MSVVLPAPDISGARREKEREDITRVTGMSPQFRFQCPKHSLEGIASTQLVQSTEQLTEKRPAHIPRGKHTDTAVLPNLFACSCSLISVLFTTPVMLQS